MKNETKIMAIINKYRCRFKLERGEMIDYFKLTEFRLRIINEGNDETLIDIQDFLQKADLKPLFDELKNYLDNFDSMFYIDVTDLVKGWSITQREGRLDQWYSIMRTACPRTHY